jgi:hypothetical protein
MLPFVIEITQPPANFCGGVNSNNDFLSEKGDSEKKLAFHHGAVLEY